MAQQLPPKVPNMTTINHNWPSFHQKLPPPPSNQHQQPSWVDEFLDFSSSRRLAHRRSVSADSIAFFDSPYVEQCRDSNGGTTTTTTTTTTEPNGFDDRFDDEQLMSMFSDEVVALPTTSNPSTPSDQNSNYDDKNAPSDQTFLQHQPKNEPGEVDDQLDSQISPPPSSDQIIDPKRVKRILANRQSAQRSRVRKLQYISELERSVTSLQTEVSALSPRVAFLDHQRLILNVDNSALKQRIAALAQDKIFKDAHQEALKKEIERLTHVFHQQNMKKINNGNHQQLTTTAAAALPPAAAMVCTDKEQQLN